MMKKYNLIILVGLLSFNSCATQKEQNNITETTDLPGVCNVDTIDHDIYNCGFCGNSCGMTTSDRCINGYCMCGLTLPCEGNMECRFGVCIAPYEFGQVCEFDDTCPDNGVCIDGHCTSRPCMNEDGDPASEWCLTGGDPYNVKVPCRSGVRVCINGEWSECLGEIAPKPETGLLSCNGIDDNCDGCVDGTITDNGQCSNDEPVGIDILYIVDVSGSMMVTVETVKTATENFSDTFAGNNNFRFALAVLPNPDESDSYIQANAKLVSDFTDLATFKTLIRSIQGTNMGAEPNWDAIYEVGTNEMGLSWRENTMRLIVMFTDEEGQSYRDPQIDETMMCSSLTHNEVVAFFVAAPYVEDFDNCGIHFLMTSQEEIQTNLEQLVGDPCNFSLPVEEQ